MNKKDQEITFSERLNELDSEKQTFMCRINNTNRSAHHSLEGVCVSVTYDPICSKYHVLGERNIWNPQLKAEVGNE